MFPRTSVPNRTQHAGRQRLAENKDEKNIPRACEVLTEVQLALEDFELVQHALLTVHDGLLLMRRTQESQGVLATDWCGDSSAHG